MGDPLDPDAVVRHAYLVARRMVAQDAARDIAQDTWIKYRRQLQRQGPVWEERQARSWIWSVASNAARSLLRKKTPCGLEPEQLDTPCETEQDPAQQVADEEQLRRRKRFAWEILADLERRDRELVILRVLEDRAWSEVAEILEENPRTLRSRYSRLLARLKVRLAAGAATGPEEERHV